MPKKDNVKTINKYVRFNYFQPYLIIDEEFTEKIEKYKELLNKIRERQDNKKRITDKQLEALKRKVEITEQEKVFQNYKASVYNMKDIIQYISEGNIPNNSLDIGGVFAEIEPETLTLSEGDEDIIGFQLTKMRNNLLPAKKRKGKIREDITLADDEYIGEFVSVLYDCKYNVFMIQSNHYGLSINQIERYFTQLRREYIKRTNDTTSIKELSCELRVIIDPNKAKSVLNAQYFKKVRIKGSDAFLNKLIDKNSKSKLSHIRRMYDEKGGFNFDISFSVNQENKSKTIDRDEIRILVEDYDKIKDQLLDTEDNSIIEITKKDTEEDNIELINLLNPRMTDIVNLKIIPRTAVEHRSLFNEMKKTYEKSRGVVSRILSKKWGM